MKHLKKVWVALPLFPLVVLPQQQPKWLHVTP